MKPLCLFLAVLLVAVMVPTCFAQLADLNANNPYDTHSLQNPYGAGNPYKSDGLNNPYSRYGSRYSDHSYRNPYATRPPRIYSGGSYHGEMSTNRYRSQSTSNPYGRYGSPYSSSSIYNRYGAGNPYSTRPMYVWPSW